MSEKSKQYALLLKSPEWKSKRITILNRDNNSCQKCRSKTKLHVHHKKYIVGKMPWEVPNSYLQTLCETCHDKAHEGRNISSFFVSDKAKKKKVKKAALPNKKNKPFIKLTKRELLLQIDELKKRDLDKLNTNART